MLLLKPIIQLVILLWFLCFKVLHPNAFIVQGTLTQYYEQLRVSLENLRLYTGNTEARDLKTSCQCKLVLTKW
ncbi:hypothetical protein E1A91_D07G206800v1 [Gossypium mustelinum]|uniref:Secreted protein n=1 Tax=Gossypium mustelinum TaxID=34275 RepID=A0A5D2UAG8_GOSMU|nr:hypothetical protein E1A91_D07G206800v1 [Gossypium mustelinum]